MFIEHPGDVMRGEKGGRIKMCVIKKWKSKVCEKALEGIPSSLSSLDPKPFFKS